MKEYASIIHLGGHKIRILTQVSLTSLPQATPNPHPAMAEPAGENESKEQQGEGESSRTRRRALIGNL